MTSDERQKLKELMDLSNLRAKELIDLLESGHNMEKISSILAAGLEACDHAAKEFVDYAEMIDINRDAKTELQIAKANISERKDLKDIILSGLSPDATE